MNWLLTPLALATSPLVPAADVADVGLQVWWREGDLLVGVPGATERPGLRPLTSLAPLELPADLTGWTALGADCADTPDAAVEQKQKTHRVTIGGTTAQPIVQLWVDEHLAAHHQLGRPVKPCSVHLAQADELPGPEVVVVWTLQGSQPVRGVTVYHVPEAIWAAD